MTPVRIALLSLLIAAFFAPSALAQDPTPTPTPTVTPQPEPRIKEGVFAGGIDLSNLTVPEAEARLH